MKVLNKRIYAYFSISLIFTITIKYNSSYISFDENNKGILEAGKNADFAVLSHDYFNCHEDDIKNITSIMTVVDGNVVYSVLQRREN